MLWIQSKINEIDRLAGGRVGNGITPTKTLIFIPDNQLPASLSATYLHVVASFLSQKAYPYRIIWTAGGNKIIDYPGEVSTPTADMNTSKLLLNSTISTLNASFMCMDIKEFYLDTPMGQDKYIWVPIRILPETFIENY